MKLKNIFFFILAACLLSFPLASANWETGVVAMWQAENTTGNRDVFGNFPLTPTNVASVEGLIGNGWLVSGGYMSGTGNATIASIRTIAFWMRNISAGSVHLINANGNTYTTAYPDGRLCSASNSGNTNIVCSTINFTNHLPTRTVNTWNLFVIVNNGSGGKIFFNNNSMPVSNTALTNNFNFNVAFQIAGGSAAPPSNIVIDNFMLSTAEWNQSEVNEFWNNGAGINYGTPPAFGVNFIEQKPTDINTTTLFSTPTVNITYAINLSNLITNASTPFLNYTMQGIGCIEIRNGTCSVEASGQKAYSSNASSTFLFQMTENELYPSLTNLQSLSFNTSHLRRDLSNTDLVKQSFLNFSTAQRFNYLEIDLLSQDTTGSSAVFLCNNSYSTGNPASAASCFLIEDFTNKTYNHIHFSGASNHSLFSVPVNSTSATIGNALKVYDGVVWAVMRGAVVGDDSVGYVNQSARTNSYQISNNGGNTWTSEAFTLDAHIHQYNGTEIFNYTACAQNASLTVCSSVSQKDNLDVTVLPPTSPLITFPANETNTTRFINVTWQASVPFNSSITITNYSVFILNETDGTMSQVGVVNSSTLFFLVDFYLQNITNGTRYIKVTASDSFGLQSSSISAAINLTYPINHLNITLANFTNPDGFFAAISNSSVQCTNAITENKTVQVVFNGILIYNATANNTAIILNSSLIVDGINTLSVACFDFLEQQNATESRQIFVKTFCLVDEQTNQNFTVSNLTRAVLYYDDNRTSFNYQTLNTSCVTFASANETKLRMDLGYASGESIERYIDVTLLGNETDIRVCANKQGVTHFEQLVISSSSKPVIIKSVFADCYIAVDYTRFAYQDALLLKAYTATNLYYLYTITGGSQVFLAAIDGTIATYINLDTLEFKLATTDINILSDTLVFKAYAENVTQIYYKNPKNDNTAAHVTIMRMDTGAVVFNSAAFANPNNISILFDVTTLNANLSTVFKITVNATRSSGESEIISKYFNAAGKSGYINSALAFVISFLLMVFGLSLASARITFSWFGAVIVIAAIAILAFSILTWYSLFLMGIEIIVLLFIIILMVFTGSRMITGGVA